MGWRQPALSRVLDLVGCGFNQARVGRATGSEPTMIRWEVKTARVAALHCGHPFGNFTSFAFAISLIHDFELVPASARGALEDRFGDRNDAWMSFFSGVFELHVGQFVFEFLRDELQHLPTGDVDSGLSQQSSVELHQGAGCRPHEVQALF